MAGLLDLANEIIQDIWALIYQPADIVSFALASKFMAEQGEQALEKHVKMATLTEAKRRISELSLSAMLLNGIQQNPRARHYIQQLTIDENMTPFWWGSTPRFDALQSVITRAMTQYFRTSFYFRR